MNNLCKSLLVLLMPVLLCNACFFDEDKLKKKIVEDALDEICIAMSDSIEDVSSSTIKSCEEYIQNLRKENNENLLIKDIEALQYAKNQDKIKNLSVGEFLNEVVLEHVKQNNREQIDRIIENAEKQETKEHISQVKHYIKLLFITSCILFLLVLFLLISRLNRKNHSGSQQQRILKKRAKNKSQQFTLTDNSNFKLETENIRTGTKPIIKKARGPMTSIKEEWCTVGASIIGISHIRLDLPCQDSHYYEDIGNSWGIAVVADGAGSAKNSHIGSAFVAREAAPRIFKQLILDKGWHKDNKLPSETEWHKLAKAKLKEIRGALEIYANHNKIKSKSLACTLIVVIYSPVGILVTHIGDGRAGYLDLQNDWKPMITPWKGEEPNLTIFLTSSIWNDDIDQYIEPTHKLKKQTEKL